MVVHRYRLLKRCCVSEEKQKLAHRDSRLKGVAVLVSCFLP